jgi:uncharacterized RDD family membrane protein YckC
MADRLAASGLGAGARAQAGLASNDGSARLATRALAYLVDSFVLFGFLMLFAAAAFLNVFLQSDYGEGHLSDDAEWSLVAILMVALPAWLVLNLILVLRRGQTIGQYIMGLEIRTEEGEAPRRLRLLAYWLALHPLLFHPLFAFLWLFFALVTLSLTESVVAVVVTLTLALLCVVAPLGGLIFTLVDPQGRAIHDRLAGIKVVDIGRDEA